MKPTKIQNYRGIRDAFLVTVLEGNGTPENPYQEVDYVISQKLHGSEWRFETIGKIVSLSEEEKEADESADSLQKLLEEKDLQYYVGTTDEDNEDAEIEDIYQSKRIISLDTLTLEELYDEEDEDY